MNYRKRSQTQKLDLLNVVESSEVNEVSDQFKSLFDERRDLVDYSTKLTKTVQKFRMSLKNLEVMSTMMYNLLKDLLDLGQIDKKSFQLNNEYFDLEQTIEKAFMMAQGSADLKKVQLFRAPIKDDERFLFKRIYGDQNRYIQIIVNFLSNAIKFSKSNSVVNVIVTPQEHVEKRVKCNTSLNGDN